MRLRTIIIDDEPIALAKLKSYTEKTPTLELVGEFQSGFDALEFLTNNSVDLIISDINMPDMTGLEFVRSLSNPPMIIFITAHPQYAVESYKVSAIDYLLKPYDFADFSNSIKKALTHYEIQHKNTPAPQNAEPETIFIKTDTRYVRITLSEIIYIKGYGEYLRIYTQGKETPLTTLSSFAAIKEHLSEDFLQVHRSYIVNMNQVMQIERNRILIDRDTIIPIGESFKPAFQEYLSGHTIGKMSK
jgi:DNA-binding LytR/AlgR family response regulator